MSETKVLQICVHCPWSVQEELLLDIVAPFLEAHATRGTVEDWFYIRESYDGDTFIRFRVRCGDPALEWSLAAEIRRHMAGRTPAPPGELLAYVPYNRDVDWLGGPEATPLTERFWTDTTPLAVSSLRATRDSRADRYALALDGFVATGWLLSQDLPGPLGELRHRAGFLSYRATVEGWLLLVGDAERLRERYEEQYRRNRGRLTRRLEELIDLLEARRAGAHYELDAAPFAVEWVTHLERYLPEIRRGFESGRFSLHATPRNDEMRRLQAEAPRSLYERPDVDWLADAPTRPTTGIHLAIADNYYFQWFIRHDPRFMTVRLGGAYFFWHLFRLGLTLTDRYLLAYLTARTFEDVYGVDAAEVIRRITPEVMR